MARVAPDSNDVFVLLLNDGPGTHINTGTLGSAGNLTDYGSPISGATGVFGSNGYYVVGLANTSSRDGCDGANSVVVSPQISMSGWVFPRKTSSTSFFSQLWSKQYVFNNFVAPFVTFGSEMFSDGSGQFNIYITINGSRSQISSGASYPLQAGRWCHVGGTWDGTTLKSYLNGNLIGTLVPTAGTIDYDGANTGPWFIGGVPAGSGNNQNGGFIYSDFRVANIARPQSYFANIYFQGISLNG